MRPKKTINASLRRQLKQRDARKRETKIKTEPKARAKQSAGLFAQLKILFEKWWIP
nr:MAG TPA: hypothetical protein [Caudoviricetes sp.]